MAFGKNWRLIRRARELEERKTKTENKTAKKINSFYRHTVLFYR
jgi:hypothetical protein